VIKEGRTLDILACSPIIIVGHHEPLIFRRRAGYAVADEQPRYLLEHSEHVAAGLARRGVTWVRTHFFKGFGLAAEADEIDITAREIQQLHRHGIKVELYTQLGTLQYESFLAEEPGCLDWCAVDPNNQLLTIVYGHHDFRAQPCLLREGYWAYLRKVIQKGLEIGADGFGFDNVCNTKLPDVCHCPQCRTAFIAYLKAKYRPDTPEGAALAKERFGFSVLDHIRPPTFNSFNPARAYKILINPVFQDWTDFRTDALAHRFREIWEHIKSQKAGVMIEYNVYPPMTENAAWYDGIDMHKLLPWMDVSWNERPPAAPGITKDGHFWHRVHAYKLAEAYGRAICTFNAGGTPGQISLAAVESMVFNGGHLGGFESITRFAEGAAPEADVPIAFRKSHPELFDNTRSAAKVGLVESALSLARNCVEPHHAELMAMSSLLARQVPFDIVPQLTAERIAPYNALVLCDVEILTDSETALLLDYVGAGGGLVFTGRTSLYDAWRRRRPEPSLAPILKAARGFDKIKFGADARENTNVTQSAKSGLVLKGNYGKGRFIYISRLVPAKPYDYANIRVADDLWVLPRNAKLFSEAVKYARGPQAIEVSAPPSLAVEVRIAPDGRTLIHLLNYKVGKPALPVSIDLLLSSASKANGGETLPRARVFILGQSGPKALKMTRTMQGRRSTGQQVATLQVGAVPCYAVVEIEG